MVADVQVAHNSAVYNTDATTIAATFGSAVGSGSMVVGIATFTGGTWADFTSITDDQGNTYTIIDHQSDEGTLFTLIFYKHNITNAPTVITMNLSVAHQRRAISIREVSGLGTSDPLDGFQVFGTNSNTGTDTGRSRGYDSRWDGSYIFGGINDYSGGLAANTYSAGTGFSGIDQVGDATHQSIASEYKVQTNAGYAEAWFTLTTSSSNACCYIIAFAPSKPSLGQHVQSAADGTGSNPSNNLWSTSFPRVVGNGNHVMGIVTWGSDTTSTLTSIDDDKGNSYTIVRRIGSGPHGQSCATFYCENITNGPITVTAHFNANFNWRGIAIREATGLLSSGSLDKEIGQDQSTAPGTGTDAVKSTQITPASNGQYIFGAAVCTTTMLRSLYAAGTNFSRLSSAGALEVLKGSMDLSTEHLIQGTAAAIEATFTQNSNQEAMCFVMTFKPAAGGGTTPINFDMSDDSNNPVVLSRNW